MKLNQILAAVAIAASASAAMATAVTVDAFANSTMGGSGAGSFALTAGQSFSVTAPTTDLWSSGPLPRWSDADGLTHSLTYSVGMDSEVLASFSSVGPGTLIGQDWGTYSQNGLTSAYGTLVGQIDSGSFFKIGTNYAGTAASTGTLKLFYFDSNNYDNSGSIVANVTAVPEPEMLSMMLAGLGIVGFVTRRRKTLGKLAA